jgi:hypothetical protein
MSRSYIPFPLGTYMAVVGQPYFYSYWIIKIFHRTSGNSSCSRTLQSSGTHSGNHCSRKIMCIRTYYMEHAILQSKVILNEIIKISDVLNYA